MKTTLLSILLALSPGFAFSSFAQENKPDAPREEQLPDAPREEKKEPAERERHQPEAQAREEIEKKVKAAMEEAAKLDEAGKKDAAENLRREARQMAQAAKAHERAAGERRHEGEDRKLDGPPRAEIENKLKHVEQAIAHLREAGLPEPAEHLNQIANRFRAALHGPDQPRREEGRREEPRREDRRPDNDIEALRREIQELRQAVRQLNEQRKQ